MSLIPRASLLVLGTILFTNLGTHPCTSAEEPSAESVMKKVAEAYAAMETYQAEGTVVADIDTGKTKIKQETTFSIRLKKPDMYRITWQQTGPVSQSGAVWRQGGKPFLYMSALKAFSQMSNDEMALGGATGISGGAAYTIPSMFLNLSGAPSSPLQSLKNPRLEATETVDGEACYKISGATAVSKNETYWISKENSLIRKYSRSLETPDAQTPASEMTDEQIEEALKGLGEEVNAETKASMKKRMASIKKMMTQVKLKGQSTESQNDISSPELQEDDFDFKPPANTEQKKSLFGNFLQAK